MQSELLNILSSVSQAALGLQTTAWWGWHALSMPFCTKFPNMRGGLGRGQPSVCSSGTAQAR